MLTDSAATENLLCSTYFSPVAIEASRAARNYSCRSSQRYQTCVLDHTTMVYATESCDTLISELINAMPDENVFVSRREKYPERDIMIFFNLLRRLVHILNVSDSIDDVRNVSPDR